MAVDLQPTVPDASGQAALWEAVDALIDRAPSVAALREHRLHLLAARRWRALGRTVDDETLLDETRAAMAQLAVQPLLARARDAVDGPLLVFKGPEIAALYPEPTLRSFGDVDVLVADAPAAQRALISAGFEEVGDPSLYVGIHHLRPLRWPGLPLCLEVHLHPKWLDRVVPPPFEALAEGAVPSSSGIDGVQTLDPVHHALVVAVHSWAHQPLRQIAELVDLAAVCRDTERATLERAARAWGIEKLWRTVSCARDAVLFGGRGNWHLGTWARSLTAVRTRTVLEVHLEQLLAPFGVEAPVAALSASTAAVLADLRPGPAESWPRKLRRTGRAIRNAREPRSEHDRELLERELL